eukprot:4093572-Pleurochrysis_carterae.AAC.1
MQNAETTQGERGAHLSRKAFRKRGKPQVGSTVARDQLDPAVGRLKRREDKRVRARTRSTDVTSEARSTDVASEARSTD